MKFLFFDTETNGLPRSFYAPVHRTENWPAILSIAWQLWDITSDAQTRLESFTAIIKPGESIVWDADAEKIHGISREIAERDGVPGDEVMHRFVECAKTAHVIVAHNLHFDKSIVLSDALRRNPRASFGWFPRFEYCTCVSTTELCKLPSRNPRAGDPYKRPKLTELYTFLYGTTSDVDFHTAAGDVECLVQCFLELLRRSVVPLAAWERCLRV